MREFLNKIKRFFFEENVYSIGIRKREDKLLFEGNNKCFKVLPITRKEWYADPIVFTYNGIDYLFCEVYDRKNNVGNIGVTVINGQALSKPQICLSIGSHLSYPMIFQLDSIIYMIPETTTTKNMVLYRAVDFPDKWEPVHTLISNIELADSTIFNDGDNTILFTYEQFNGNGSVVKIRVFDANSINLGRLTQISEGDSYSNQLRGAGNLFFHKGKLIRPSQDCSKEYGYALNFNKVKSYYNQYQEEKISTVLPVALNTDLEKKIIGVHTYACTDKYEIIDVKFNDVRILHQIKRLLKYINRNIKRVLDNANKRTA